MHWIVPDFNFIASEAAPNATPLPPVKGATGMSLIQKILDHKKTGSLHIHNSAISRCYSQWIKLACHRLEKPYPHSLPYQILQISSQSKSFEDLKDIKESMEYFPTIYHSKKLSEINAIIRVEAKYCSKESDASIEILTLIDFIELGRNYRKLLQKDDYTDCAYTEKMHETLGDITQSIKIISEGILKLTPEYTAALINEILTDHEYDIKKIKASPPRLAPPPNRLVRC